MNPTLLERDLKALQNEKVDVNSLRIFIEALDACPQVVKPEMDSMAFAEFLINGVKVISLYTCPEQYFPKG
jgi:hypothetical protein